MASQSRPTRPLEASREPQPPLQALSLLLNSPPCGASVNGGGGQAILYPLRVRCFREKSRVCCVLLSSWDAVFGPLLERIWSCACEHSHAVHVRLGRHALHLPHANVSSQRHVKQTRIKQTFVNVPVADGTGRIEQLIAMSVLFQATPNCQSPCKSTPVTDSPTLSFALTVVMHVSEHNMFLSAHRRFLDSEMPILAAQCAALMRVAGKRSLSLICRPLTRLVETVNQIDLVVALSRDKQCPSHRELRGTLFVDSDSTAGVGASMLSMILTNVLITSGRCVIVGHEPRLVAALLNTLALFLPESLLSHRNRTGHDVTMSLVAVEPYWDPSGTNSDSDDPEGCVNLCVDRAKVMPDILQCSVRCDRVYRDDSVVNTVDNSPEPHQFNVSVPVIGTRSSSRLVDTYTPGVLIQGITIVSEMIGTTMHTSDDTAPIARVMQFVLHQVFRATGPTTIVDMSIMRVYRCAPERFRVLKQQLVRAELRDLLASPCSDRPTPQTNTQGQVHIHVRRFWASCTAHSKHNLAKQLCGALDHGVGDKSAYTSLFNVTCASKCVGGKHSSPYVHSIIKQILDVPTSAQRGVLLSGVRLLLCRAGAMLDCCRRIVRLNRQSPGNARNDGDSGLERLRKLACVRNRFDFQVILAVAAHFDPALLTQIRRFYKSQCNPVAATDLGMPIRPSLAAKKNLVAVFADEF